MYYFLTRESKVFICSKCNKVSKAGEKINKVVTQTRNKTYKNIVLDYKGKIVYNRETKLPVEKISAGYETVKEENRCGDCL